MAVLKKNEDGGVSYSEYCCWPEDERWEIIEGIPFDMTPAPGRLHQRICLDLGRFLVEFFEGKSCEVYIAPFDVRLPSGDEEDDKIKTVVQPDLAVICDKQKLDDKGCRGAPDFVIEVLSPSTSSKDNVLKKRIYERHGVREFWLVHPVERMITVYRLESDGKFGPAEILEVDGLKLPVSIFPGLVIDFKRVFPPLSKIIRESPRKYKK